MLAKSGQVERDHVEPVKEVRAELFLADGFLQILVRGRKKAHIQLDGARPADAHKFAFLEDAQQFCLECKRKFPHFIKENAPTLGDFQETLFLANSAGESSFFVAEELALEKRLCDRGTVQRDELGHGVSGRESDYLSRLRTARARSSCNPDVVQQDRLSPSI